MSYAKPDSLVTTQWVEEHIGDPKVRVIEVDVDTNAFDEGHVPGALGWNWATQLCDRRTRDILHQGEMQELLRSSGIEEDTTIVLYGTTTAGSRRGRCGSWRCTATRTPG